MVAVLLFALFGVPAGIRAAGFSDFAVYATGTGCGAITISGKAYTDSFDSTQGTYAQTKKLSQGAIGATGNIRLDGNATVNGGIFTLDTDFGECRGGIPGITLSGKAQVIGGYIQLSAPVVFPAVTAVSAGTMDVRITTDTTLAPGNYGNVTVTGAKTLSLSTGTYNLKSLTVSGDSRVAVSPVGPVLVNLTGENVSQAIDLSGGSLDNPSGIPMNFKLVYGGILPVTLSGGATAYGVLYAPNAPVRLSGGSDWYGAIVAGTLDDSGGTAIHFDRSLAIPPVITPLITPAPNAAGWNNANVTVTFTCADSMVGVASCSPPVLVNMEGANQVVTGTAVNRAGFSVSASTIVNVDKTSPLISASTLPPRNAAGWNNSNVTVSFLCSDGLSGIALCPGAILVTGEGAGQVISGTAADKAGNTTTTATTINLDKTSPAITATMTPPPNGAGWNNTNVTVTFVCSDALSGVATCPAAVQVTPEGTGQVISGTATDRAGNAASTSATTNVDKTPPTITASVSPLPNAEGWNDSDVTVTFTCSDALSGIASCPAPVSVTANGANQVISGTATDRAGNTATATVTINLDKSMPTITGSIAPAPNPAGWNNANVTVTFTCSDATSGIASCTSPVSVTTEGQNQAIAGSATSIAGDTASTTVNVNLDKTPPSLTITSPMDGSVFSPGPVTVTGTVTDLLSGVASVTCQGAPATFSGANFTCSVTAAQGPNTFVVQASDVAGNTAQASVNLQSGIPTILSAIPNSAQQGQQNIPVVLTGQYAHWVQGTTSVSFGAGTTVLSLNISSPISATAVLNVDPAAVTGSRDITVTTGTEVAVLKSGFAVTPGGPMITGFAPSSAPVGSLVTVNGTHFIPSSGGVPQLSLSKQGGGTLAVVLSGFTNTSLSFVIPAGAASGPISVTAGGQTAASATDLTIVASTNFTLTASPATATLIQGQSVSYAVQISGTSGFSQLAQLAVTGLPTGISASFKPPSITGGQTSTLTLSAPSGQASGSSALTIAATATVQGIPIQQTATVQLVVQAPTTSFVGRTVVSDALETPLSGVTVKMLGKDGSGNTTGCTGQTISDAAGNFLLAGLPASCTGPQLIGYDGTTATSPPGKYAGVNLLYTLTSGQVTASPVLVHLPRIDNTETFNVQQNAASDQSYSFTSIPGLALTVYAHTTFTMPDGTQPNPFPLTAVRVPVDRLPDLKPPVPTMLNVFIVAFQPANVTANQPVAVYYPNALNTAPGTDMALLTLDPTLGKMVPYGTGAVSSDGLQVVPDSDPAHPGHRYGIVHFDWHGSMPPPLIQSNPPPPDLGGDDDGLPAGADPPGGPSVSTTKATPSPTKDCPPGCDCQKSGDPAAVASTTSGATAGDPVDLSTGLQTVKSVDISVSGSRGGLTLVRVYRSMTTQPGPFGIGTGHNYNYRLDTAFPQLAATINLIMPDGNRFPFFVGKQCPQLAGAVCAPGRNSTVPALQGLVMTVNSDNSVDLRWKNGTIWHFIPTTFQLGSFLSSITDANGNTVTLTRNPSDPSQLTQVTDPVGRSLTLAYDGSDRITSATDQLGRKVTYTYNSQGTLATVTDPAGGVTTYAYDTNNNMLSLTDPRGTIQFQNTLDAQGRVIKQVRPDGGVLTFSYTFANPLATSPALQAQVTDGLGVQANYRFDVNGFLTDVTSTQGLTRHIDRAPGTHLRSGLTLASASETYTYDSNGNVLSETDATLRTTQFTYDPVFNKVTTVTDPAGSVTRFSYDGHGNLSTVTDPNGNITSYRYDSTGLLTQVTDAVNHTTKLGYDGFGNLVTVTDPLGNVTSYAYDAISRLVQTTDALGRRTRRTYDPLGRVLTQTDARGGVTTFAYDPNGNPVAVTDARGNSTTFTYDPMNRLATRTDPLGKADARTYDTNGRITKYVDRRGLTSTFAYDNLNRLIQESYADATVTRSYDFLGRLAQVNDSASGVFTMSRDLAGRLLESSSPFGTATYTYDARGAMASRQVAGAPAVSYTYDPAGNLTSAAMPQASTTFMYNSLNQVAAINRSNGVTSTYTYDPAGQLLSLTHSSGSTLIDSETYGYDPVGSRSSHSTSIGQALITQPVMNQFNVANQLTQFGSVPNAYDADGNLLEEGSTTAYTWDARKRLKTIMTSAGQTTTFTYDFAGNLIAQADTGTSLNLTKTFVLDDLTNVAYESASDGNSYSVLSGRSIDSHLAVAHSSGQIQYGLPDAVNSTVATVDQAGSVTSRAFYEPFGQTSGAEAYPFQFTGRTSVGSKLNYFRARFYNSQTGRFISEDPIGLRGGDPNLYRYVTNNPVRMLDPQGLDAKLGVGCGVAAAVGCTFLPPPLDIACGLESIPACEAAGGQTPGLGCEEACSAITTFCPGGRAVGIGTGLASVPGCPAFCQKFFPKQPTTMDVYMTCTANGQNVSCH